MTVQCPYCSTAYLLPERLLGERGARVRCPTCGGGFQVAAVVHAGAGAARVPITETAPGMGSGSTREAEPAPRPTVSPAPPAVTAVAAGPTGDPAAVAHAVLEVFETFLGDALSRARERGTVLSEHGPALLAVWDEFRKRAGGEASSVVFRAALRDRLGVDLTTAHER
jgi:predicted Zn finger-like uncharacterized protein